MKVFSIYFTGTILDESITSGPITNNNKSKCQQQREWEIACVVIWVWFGRTLNQPQPGLGSDRFRDCHQNPPLLRPRGLESRHKACKSLDICSKTCRPNCCLHVHTPGARSSSEPIVAPEMQRHRKDQTDRASFLEPHHGSPASWRNPYVPKQTTAECHFWR